MLWMSLWAVQSAESSAQELIMFCSNGIITDRTWIRSLIPEWRYGNLWRYYRRIAGRPLMCKIRKVRFVPAVDLAAGGFFIGQAIGRWGNFVNIEALVEIPACHGAMSSSVITSYLTEHEAELEALGMNIDPNMPVHPTFLSESIWCLLGFCFLLVHQTPQVWRRTHPHLYDVVRCRQSSDWRTAYRQPDDSKHFPCAHPRCWLWQWWLWQQWFGWSTPLKWKSGWETSVCGQWGRSTDCSRSILSEEGRNSQNFGCRTRPTLFTGNAEQSAETAEKKKFQEVTSEQPEDAAAEER